MSLKLKVLLGCLLLALTCIVQEARANSKEINVTVGQTFTINPWADRDAEYNDFSCISTRWSIDEDDRNAFSINTDATYRAQVQITPSGGYYEEGFYSTYKVLALKEGNFIIKCTCSCRKIVKNSVYNFVSTTEYHVIVSKAPVVTNISVDKTVTLYVGDTYKYDPVIVEAGAKTSLTWTSNNPSVATISRDGILQALSVGTTNITCTAENGVTAQSVVTVHPNMVSEVVLDNDELTLEIGNTTRLEATVLPENASNKQLFWTSSDPNVIMVGTNGLIVANKAGFAIVTASATDGSNASASCIVKAIEPQVRATSIGLNYNNLTLTKGDSYQLTATFTPANVSTRSIMWSSNSDCVTVDENGNLTAVRVGTATISASTKDGSELTVECIVTVEEKDLAAYDNIVYFEPAIAHAGKSIVMPLKLNNKEQITAIQFDLTLPEGFSIEKRANGNFNVTLDSDSGRADNTTHTVSCALQDDGSVRILVYSTSLETFEGSEGAILNIPLIVAEDVAKGDYLISLDDIVMTDVNEQRYAVDNYTSIVTVITATLGDVNGDNTIDVTDIVSLANNILGKSAGTFIEDAADLNQDSRVDVTDIVTLANLILGNTSSRSFTSRASDENVAYLEILPFTMEPGEKSLNLTLDLYNPATEITAFQLDLQLPEGITVDLNRRGTAYNLSFNTDFDRTDASYHTLTSAEQSNGDIRILCYSTSLDTFWGEDGAVINIPVTADAAMAPGVYTFALKNIVLTKPDETRLTPADYTGSIIIGNGGEVSDVVLQGAYTDVVIKEFSAALTNNDAITSIDLTGAFIDSSATSSSLTCGNTNALVFVLEGQPLGNETNLVIGDNCENLTLIDAGPFNTPRDFTATSATYTRKTSPGTWSTICLPFAPEENKGVEYEKLVSLNESNLSVIFASETAPQAYTPYIIKSASEELTLHADNVEIGATPAKITDNCFIGFLGHGDQDSSGLYDINPDGTFFVKSAVVHPFHSAINLEGMNIDTTELSIIHGEISTGINSVTIDAIDAHDCYDLLGRKVDPTKVHGIVVISKGYKYIIK